MAVNKIIREKAKEFAKRWKGKASEISDADNFWLDLLESVFGIDTPYNFIDRQKEAYFDIIAGEKTEVKRVKHIDIYIPKSGCLIEHKSATVSLDSLVRQSDGTRLTARQQAQRYYNSLDRKEQGRYIIACNFKKFVIFDNDHKRNPEVRFSLEDISRHVAILQDALLSPLNPTAEEKAEQEYKNARSAYEFVQRLYELLKGNYSKSEQGKELDHLLNVFCVRVVFCLYADDSGLFEENALKNFLESYTKISLLEEKFEQLFYALNTLENKRKHLDREINVFRHVNGGLFGEEKAKIPKLSEEIRQLLLQSLNTLYKPDSDEMPFHWSDISPTNFGCIFENTVPKLVRKNQGMHYTTVENIHRVIDPLFLNNLRDELNRCLQLPLKTTVEQVARDQALDNFIKKMGRLKFLDPACGSGNFLTETFRSLRQLEHEALCAKTNKDVSICAVRISQFFGIEIDDFACQVAKTAMWIAWCQMEQEVKALGIMEGRPLPLESNTTICRADALTTDWNIVVKNSSINYIIGNPPFMGSQGMKQAGLKGSFDHAFSKIVNVKGKKLWKSNGNMDYVCAWFAKAAAYMHEHNRVRTAFVATNSITQGEQVSVLWEPLVTNFNLQIPFAWRSFSWFNEATDSANVHCVIVAMCCQNTKLSRDCVIYEEGKEPLHCSSINSYLLPSKQLFLKLSDPHVHGTTIPSMRFGSMPNDTIEIENTETGKKSKVPMLRLSAKERKELCLKYPELEKYLPRIFGSDDFISNEENYCIWLDGDVPSEIIQHVAFKERFKQLKDKRLASTRDTTRTLADTPYLFGEIRQPSHDYLLVPGTSSENRKYIPMGYVSKDTICSNAAMTINDCPLWLFAILTSSIHMAWVKIVCGRLEMRYRYSIRVVYDNFPFPELTEEQISNLNDTAQKILDVREKNVNDTLETLYRVPMKKDLLDAHRANDKAVFKAYEYLGLKESMTDEEIALALLRESVKLSAKHEKRKKVKRKKK